jgi:UDP-N-acetylenolpyruvoylglucosamine reductase
VRVGERDALAAAVSGPVLLPGEDGFVEEKATFNRAISHSPALIVGAVTAADVQAAVRFAAARQLAVAVLSTGHGPSLPVTEETVLITTRRMTGVVIDAVARIARVEAGACWQQVVDEAVEVGLAPLVGSSPTVGVTGYTLGGGLSVTMGRAKGWAADHVRAMDVVTADGRLRNVTADSETDLFWALRGAKSNFGVVTAIEFDLFPVEQLYAGGLFFSGEHAAEVLHAYQQFATKTPDELTSSIALIRMPDVPHVAEFMRGKLTVNVRFSYLGPSEAGEELIAPLRAAAPVVMDTVKVRPYSEFAQISPGSVEPVSSVEHFALLNELTPSTVDALVDVVGPAADTTINIVDIRQLGGALERPVVRNAIQSHGAGFVIFTLTLIPPEQAASKRAAGLELIERLRPWLSERKCPNFLSPADASVGQTRKAYAPSTYERLQSIKGGYDAKNMFRFNHNIPPRAAGTV